MAEQQKQIIAGLCATLDNKQDIVDGLCGDIESLQARNTIFETEFTNTEIHINRVLKDIVTLKAELKAAEFKISQDKRRWKISCDANMKLEKERIQFQADDTPLRAGLEKIQGKLNDDCTGEDCLDEKNPCNQAIEMIKKLLTPKPVDGTLKEILSDPAEDIWDDIDKPACETCGNEFGGFMDYEQTEPCPTCAEKGKDK